MKQSAPPPTGGDLLELAAKLGLPFDRDNPREFLAYFSAMLDESQAATEINASKRTLQGWRVRGDGPPFLRLTSRMIRYRRCDLLTWAADRACTSTSQAA